MKKHSINFSDIKPNGNAAINVADGMAEISTTRSITGYSFHLSGNSYKKNYVSLPEKYHLPFRIDMTIKLDHPAFLLQIGDGHIYFASGHDTAWDRIKDIAKPESKPCRDNYAFDSRVPLGEFVDISIIYNPDDMQILIGGEERFYSRKQPFMSKKQAEILSALNTEGFALGLAVTKHSVLTVKEITIFEHDDNIPITRGSFELPALKAPKPEREKPTFDNVLAKVSPQFQPEILEMDTLFKSLRPMKFKRVIDKSVSKITYVASEVGISYTIVASGAETYHHFGWYLVYSGPVETWHRRADYMEEILAEIAKTDAALAEFIFSRLADCNGCYPGGLCKTPYEFNGNKVVNCHGRVVLQMNTNDFNNVREFFRYLNKFIERKIMNGDPPPEKIILINTRRN